MRQGAQSSGWLVRDVFSPEAHQPAFMFSLYVGIGKLAGVLGVPAMVLERLTEVVARTLFVVALWRFCRAFALSRNAARAALLLALFGSGFEVFAAALGGLLGRPVYSGNWSYELNSLGLLFAAPHVPLAAAATLELAQRWLKPARATPLSLAATAVLGAVTALLHPFHVPVLLGALGLVGLVYGLSHRGWGTLIASGVAGLAALPVLAPTVATFSLDPFWAATYSVQNLLPSPRPHELLVDLGPSLVLAIGGALARRAGVAPFGVLIWLLLALIAMYLPVPYQRRLSFGAQPAVALVAGNALVAACAALDRRRASILRLSVVASAASASVLVLVGVVASGVSNAPLGVYRSTSDLDAAAAWLEQRTGSGDLVLADWDAANYLAPRIGQASTYGGHPVASLHPDQKELEIATLFAHDGSSSRDLARRMGVRWLVYGPAEANLPGPPAPPAFTSGAVRVFEVAQA
jgi:chromate transport protein ChrA